MDYTRLLVFAGAYLAILILPGPGVTALVARVIARGTHGSAAFIAGFVAGSLTWFTIAATGLAVLASSFAALFVAIRYIGGAYLLYLALKLWNAPTQSPNGPKASPDKDWRLFLTGLSINLGNPKVIVFFLALLPTVVDLGTLSLLGFAELAIIIATVASTVLAVYAFVAARARRLLHSKRSVRILNRGSATVMAGAAVSIAVRRLAVSWHACNFTDNFRAIIYERGDASHALEAQNRSA
jgi:threonine/homoserine/homoserine lactone efflux protein